MGKRRGVLNHRAYSTGTNLTNDVVRTTLNAFFDKKVKAYIASVQI